MKTVKELREAIENEKARSAWGRAVKEYALELIEEWTITARYTDHQQTRKTS
jgi:hypothetical protein